MIALARAGSIVCKVLMFIWCGLLLLGMIGWLVHDIRGLGFWKGIFAFANRYSPFDLIGFVVHVVELLPALAFMWLSEKLSSWADNRAERSAPKLIG